MFPIRLLYAEDDPDTRDLICLALETEGFEIVCPETPLEFLEQAKAERWDLIMLDTWMPGMSGFELCSRIREFDLITPVIFYSAAAYEPDKRQAFQCGAQAYFVKPVPFDKLIQGIRDAIAARPAG
jgi:DNA-binding response OmpR family regulator